MTLTIGENVGPYRVIAQLGQGGMATVYKAYHASLDRYVAIKVLHPAFKEDTTFLARFQREARVLAKLEHPNIIPIYDFADHEGHPYLVMKYVEGETLKARLGQGPVALAETLKVVDAVGSALAYAHKQGILHRDIKPSNVIITNEGHYYLSDFGLARIASAGESTLSQDTMLGTPNYISPEQAKGVRDLDGRTDIYSFGVVLYEMIVGRVPFSGDTPFSVIHDHIYTPLPPPTAINPNVPEPLERLLLKALAKERDDRFADASAMMAAFHQAVSGQLPGAATRRAEMGSSSAAETASMPVPPPVEPSPTVVVQPSATATVKAPPAAPTVKAKKEAAEKSVTEKPKGKAPSWLLIGGAVLLVLCLALGALVVVGRGIRINQLRRTETAAAALATLPPTHAPPPTQPPPTHALPTGAPPTHAPPDSVAQAETAVAADINSIPAHLNLAKAYYEAGRRDDAMREWVKAAELADFQPEFYRNDILPYLKDDPITALEVLVPGLRHNNKREMWEVTAPVLERVMPLPEAEPVLQRFVDEFPDNPVPRATLARHYILTGQIDRARPLIEELRNRFPDDPVIHFVSADYFQATGRIDEAIRELEAVVNNPRTPDPMRKAAQDRINRLKGTPLP